MQHEEIYHTKPGWASWQIHLAFGLLVLIAGVFSERRNVGLLLVFLAVAVFGYVYLARAKSRYVVTESKVHTERGIVRRRSKDITINEITSISVERSLLGRLLGDGDVRIQTGSMGGVLTLENVPNPDRFVDAVQDHQR